MIKLRYVLVVAAAFLKLNSEAQEVIIPLYENPVLQAEAKDSLNSKLKSGTNTTEPSGLLTLPFYDDFARTQYRPEPTLWEDNYAYINPFWGIRPPTVGVASLDALNEWGKLYPAAGASQFEADMLTSRPINAGSFTLNAKSNYLFIKRNDYQKISDSLYRRKKGNQFALLSESFLFEADDTVFRKIGETYIPISDKLYTLSPANQYIEILGSEIHKKVTQAYTPSDSVYLTFYYQAGGRAAIPTADGNDSLVLECYAPYKTAQGLKINEITNSWIELFNASDEIIDIANYYLAADTIKNDSLAATFRIGKDKNNNTNIEPHKHLLIYTDNVDGLVKFPNQNRKIILYNSKRQFIDSVVFDKTDSIQGSIARIPDGGPASPAPTATPNVRNGSWHYLWSTTSGSDTMFTQVQIPIADQYLAKGFQFRFRNYASLSPDASMARSTDIWNIDNVYMARYSKTEPNYADIGFSSYLTSLLSGYTSVPYKHLPAMTSTINNFFYYDIQNFDKSDRAIIFNVSINKRIGTAQDTAEVFERQEAPSWLKNNGFYSDKIILKNAPLEFFSQDCDKDTIASFDIKCFIQDDSTSMHQAFRWNDTIRYYQKFYNYYSYDDGSAEKGYGVRNGSQVACKFTMIKPDVLKAVQIYFNPTTYTSPRLFSLCVWSDSIPKNKLIGIPSIKPLFQQDGMLVKTSDGVFQFTTYPIMAENITDKTKSQLELTGKYYIGWKQYGDYLLNVGLDVNTKAAGKILYNVDNSGWQPSNESSAMMIRPLFGSDIVSLPSTMSDSMNVSIYPNPVKNELHLNIETMKNIDISSLNIRLQSITGAIVMEKKAQESFSVAEIPAGIYFLQIISNDGLIITKKIIKE